MDKLTFPDLNIFGETYFRLSEIRQMPDNISGIYMVYKITIINGKEIPSFTFFGFGNIKEGLLQCLKNPSITNVSPFQKCGYWQDVKEDYLKELLTFFNPVVK